MKAHWQKETPSTPSIQNNLIRLSLDGIWRGARNRSPRTLLHRRLETRVGIRIAYCVVSATAAAVAGSTVTTHILLTREARNGALDNAPNDRLKKATPVPLLCRGVPFAAGRATCRGIEFKIFARSAWSASGTNQPAEPVVVVKT